MLATCAVEVQNVLEGIRGVGLRAMQVAVSSAFSAAVMYLCPSYVNELFLFPNSKFKQIGFVMWDECNCLILFSLCSDMNTRAGCPAQVYKTTSAETPRPSQLAQPSPFQLSASVPKSFFSKQPMRNKHPTGWKRTDEPPPRPLPFTDPKK